MSDQCDLETLTALLDDDSDMENEASDVQRQISQNQAEDCGQESSDEDIDDDELEKLASLAEVEEKSGTPPTCRPTNVCEEDAGSMGEGNMEELLEQLEEDEDVDGQEMSELEDNGDCGPSQEELEMKLMQEKIKLLEAQLKMKKETTVKRKTPKKTISETGSLKKKAPVSSETVGNTTAAKVCQQAKKNSGNMVADIGRVVADIGKAVAHSAMPGRSRKTDQMKSVPSIKQEGSSRKLQEMNENIFFDERVTSRQSHVKPELKSSSTKPAAKSSGSKTLRINGQNETKETLFGQDSDSDWEDLDGEKNSSLSKEGAVLDRLLKKSGGNRVAHQPNRDSPTSQLLPLLLEEMPKAKSWKSKSSATPSDSMASLASLGTSSSYSSMAKQEQNKGPVTMDLFSGLRISNPLVSSHAMKMRMEGKKLVKMCRIHCKNKSSDLDSDWVTIGVIVNKSEPKMSSKGKQYSIWTMSDLDDCDKPVKMFLFGDVHKEHWKMSVGSVVGLLNPSIMQSNEKYQNSEETSITVDHGKKVMPMGTSKDLGFCKGRTKAGKDCRNFINIQKGDYCTYHVQSAYKKTSAKRAELQAGHTGVVPKSFEKKLFPSKTSCYNYGGMTITTGPSKPKNPISVNKLAQHAGHSRGKITTMSLHDIRPEDKKKMQEAKATAAAAKDQAFLDMLATPTVGSLNLVKHIVKTGGEEKVQEKKEKGIPVQSVTAKDLLKQHRHVMNEKKKEREQLGAPQPSGVFSPQLGRGMQSCGAVDLDFDAPRKPAKKLNLDALIAKRKALALLQKNGPIKKEDPNALKKVKSPDSVAKVKKRIAEESVAEREQESQPPRKRSKLLGDLDLDDPEVQKMLKAKSSHQGALTELELEKQEQYFDILEKKEKMEEKMSSIFEVKVKVVSCSKCKYTAVSQSDLCKSEGHQVARRDGARRFYKCKKCGTRTTTLSRLPTHACKHCGESSYERASMLKEKRGPKLPSEELLLRGEEVKFLNSMV